FSHIESSDAESEQLGQGSGSESEEEGDKAANIRQQLANVPFSQLIRIQQQMGTKKFNESMGMSSSKSEARRKAAKALKRMKGETVSSDSGSDSENSDSESSDSAPEMVSNKATSHDFSRDSKKKPSMMSAKRPVGRFRQVVDVPKNQTRDPRFDSLSGNFNEDLFEKSYGFLDAQRNEELESLKQQARKLRNSDPNEAERIQKLVNSMQSREASKKQRKHMQELKRTHKKKEMEAAKQGKMPYFLKKRDLKNIEVAEKFSKLKDSAKLDSFLEKRRKRNATKEHRHMPYQRREE
ncbi:rRNA biogenesis protein rrp36, partial [Linderina macrospora]